MSNDFFWMQKNDDNGNTIAFVNGKRSDGEIVAKEIMNLDESKAKLLTQKDNGLFEILKYVTSSQVILMLKGVILEKDDLGRQIGFALLKKFSRKEFSAEDVENLRESVDKIMKKIGLTHNAYDNQTIDELIEEAKNNCVDFYQKLENILRSKKTVFIVIVFILAIFFIVRGK